MATNALATRPGIGQAAQKAAAKIKRGQAKNLRVTRKVKAAIEAMVCEGLTRQEAAAKAGMSDNGLYVALTKPHVLAFFNEQMEVLRTGARPRALRTIIDLADDAESERVQLDAAKYIDGMDRNGNTVGGQQINVQVNNQVNVESPGYVIRLSRRADQGERGHDQIEHLAQHGHKPLIDNTDVPEDA